MTFMRHPSVLVTGFEPFGEHRVNPAEWVVGELAGLCHTLTVPTSYRRAHNEVLAAADRYGVSTIVMLGLAAQVTGVRVETLGRASVTADAADNDGVNRYGTRLGDPEHLPVTLPLLTVTSTLRDAGLPVATSDDAGGYVCNALLYQVLAHAESRTAGFLHIGQLADDVDGATNRLESYAAGISNVVARLDALETAGQLGTVG